MPQSHNAGPSTLRNRNRVTNKTRLKVITDNIDADPIVLQEDEEKARVVSTVGVDAEDANEHHLQAVLSAAAARHKAKSRSAHATSEKEKTLAYIPTPDSTGIVGNYEELYSPGRWRDPITYVKSSDTAEDSVSFALTDGFIYYMDERDKDWLDKNNEEARGEGTSAQGTVSGANARSIRSSKLKGKDPDVLQPVEMSEDGFELVMAIFEKVTHEKTEFLHQGLEQGTPFPPFSDYQDTFASDLTASMFAVFSVPSWVPPSPHLTRLARVIYPYWRERRLERDGYPIIPIVNLNETDTRNESYICFRQRETKSVRKTRAQQATYSDKMLRLKTELATALSLAKGVLNRESLKREGAIRVHAVWDRRFILADLKRKYPGLGNKEDEELFHDKERVAKKQKVDMGRIPLKIRTSLNGELASLAPHTEPAIRPKERQAQVQIQIQRELAGQRETDSKWEDVTDNPYQPTPAAHASKLFKFIAATRGSSSASARTTLGNENNKRHRTPRALRLRVGRGGRLYLDRRDAKALLLTPSNFLPDDGEDKVGAQEDARRHAERWRYDTDDDPAVGVKGVEEEDRELVDDCDNKYLLHHLSLLSEQDFQSLVTDVSITTTSSDGKSQTHVPFRLGAHYRKDIAIARPRSSSLASSHGIAAMQSGSPSVSLSSNGMPVAMTAQLKKMVLPTVPKMRVSSNDEMRPPGLPTLPNMYPNDPPAPTFLHNTSPAQEETSDSPPPLPSPNDYAQVSANQNHPCTNSSMASSVSPVRAKEHMPHSLTMPSVPNTCHILPVTQYTTPVPDAQYVPANTRCNGANLQQMPSLKSAFASMSPPSDAATMPINNASMQLRSSATYMGPVFPPSQNYMQMTVTRTRQMQQQWLVAQSARPASVNTAEANGTDGATSAWSPTISGMPIRTLSANGMRASAPLSRGVAVSNVAYSLSPSQGRVSPANGHIVRLSGPMSPSPHLMSTSLAIPQAH